MTNSAYRVHRTIRFEVIVVDEEDEVHGKVLAEKEKLEKLKLEDLIKGCGYDLVADEVDDEYIESWENEEEGDEEEDEEQEEDS
jgi:hypothetical protein